MVHASASAAATSDASITDGRSSAGSVPHGSGGVPSAPADASTPVPQQQQEASHLAPESAHMVAEMRSVSPELLLSIGIQPAYLVDGVASGEATDEDIVALHEHFVTERRRRRPQCVDAGTHCPLSGARPCPCPSLMTCTRCTATRTRLAAAAPAGCALPGTTWSGLLQPCQVAPAAQSHALRCCHRLPACLQQTAHEQ